MNDPFDDSDFPEDEELYEEEGPRPPSKSQVKREMHALQDLGERLLDFSNARLAPLQLSDKCLAALEEGRQIKAHGARKRHVKYLGKLLRSEDAEAIQRFLEEVDGQHAAQTRRFQALEQWRDRLIEEGDPALAEYLDSHPQAQADRQQLRQMIRDAQRERAQDKPPKTARKLFKYLRQTDIQ